MYLSCVPDNRVACALVAPRCPWWLTFAFGWPKNISFCTKRFCWMPWISGFRDVGHLTTFLRAQPWIKAGSRVKILRKLAPWPNTLSCWVRQFGKIQVFWPLKQGFWQGAGKKIDIVRDFEGKLCGKKRQLCGIVQSCNQQNRFSPSPEIVSSIKGNIKII